MKTPRVTSLDWELRVTLDRRTVVCAAALGAFATNIETWMKKDFPRDAEKIDWEKVQGLFYMILAAKNADDEFRTALGQVLAPGADQGAEL